jgi:CheY-like chemotaxis protein
MPGSCRYNQVLLVDDNTTDNFINFRIIEAAAFSEKIYVHTSAINALEFLKNIKDYPSLEEKVFPEVVFIDLNMPMINGFQFIAHYNAIADNYKIKSKLVILTSSPDETDELKAKKISEDIVYLKKPLTKDMLALI